MKERRIYKRFDAMSFWAVLGCLAVLLFESIFIFELYNRADLLEAAVSVADPEPPKQVAPTPVEDKPASEDEPPSLPVEPVG